MTHLLTAGGSSATLPPACIRPCEKLPNTRQLCSAPSPVRRVCRGGGTKLFAAMKKLDDHLAHDTDGPRIRPLADCPGYAVDEEGNVYSLARRAVRRGSPLYLKSKKLRKSLRASGYERVCLRISGKSLHMAVHRLVAKAFLGLREDQEVDHINRDKTDNRLANLRVCSRTQNAYNTPARSGMKGASFHKNTGKWRSQITYGGKHKSLGLHHTEKEAHEAYCTAARQLHGDFFHP